LSSDNPADDDNDDNLPVTEGDNACHFRQAPTQNSWLPSPITPYHP